MKALLLSLMRATLKRPALAHRIDAVLVRFPWIRGRLLRLASSGRLLDAAVAAPAPLAAGDETPFSGFVREYLEFRPHAPLRPNMFHVHAVSTGVDLERRVARLAGLELDYELISCLRDRQAIRARKRFDRQTDQHHLGLLVDHIHLALLRRYPSQVARQAHVGELARGATVEAAVGIIKMSAEYKALHRQRRPR